MPSLEEKFEREMGLEGNDLVENDYFVAGYSYQAKDLDDGFDDAIDAFIRRYNLNYERATNILLNSIIARDAYFKMMEREFPDLFNCIDSIKEGSK